MTATYNTITPAVISVTNTISKVVLSPFATAQQVDEIPAEADIFQSLELYRSVPLGIGIVAASAVGATLYSCAKIYVRRRKFRHYRTNEYAPGPTPLPILGNIQDLKRGYYETLFRFVHKPASVFWVMSDPFIIINDEEGLRQVLGGANGLYTKPRYFGYRSKAVSTAVQSEKNKVAKDSIQYEPNGDTSRKALEAMIVSSFPSIKTIMVELLQNLHQASSHEVSMETAIEEESSSIVRRFIVKLNLKLLFNAGEAQSGEIDPRRVSDMIRFAGSEFANRMVNPLKKLFDWRSNIRFMWDVGGLISLGSRLCTILDETVKCAIDDYSEAGLSKTASGVSWVHAWIGKVGTVGKLGKVVGLLMASTQTVPLAAVWMLHLVANNKTVQSQLKQELDDLDVHAIRELRYEHLDKMKMADAVVKETLRLYPPFPLIQRQAQKDNVLGEITIPTGSIVYVVPWLVHRNPKYWSEAHSFKPERFLEGSNSHGDAPSDWVYTPFGRGSRMCAGSKLAIAELKILLSCALISFEWQSRRELVLRDSKFPELGMDPKGIRMHFERKI